MTEGQEWALSQVREVEAANRVLEIVSVTAPTVERGALQIEVTLDCGLYDRVPGGLPLRAREGFVISIPPDFPLTRPDIRSQHKRFAGFSHVQWGDHLCLYQASDVEWRAEDGMFGFLDRLDVWLKAGALNQLDPIGVPLHPPAVYAKRTEPIVPQVDAPDVQPPWWAGYVEIAKENKHAILLGPWHAFDENVPNVPLVGAVLLPGPMPFEYPTSMRELGRVLADRSVPPEVLQGIMKLTALQNENGKPLYIVLGAAMRGIAGNNKRLQHLACWYISPEHATQLSTMALEAGQQEGKIAAEAFRAWADTAAVEWCPVYEDRPEIVLPRDSGSPMQWWRGRRVAILGCGALGSSVGVMVIRAGATTIRLYDNKLVSPGVLRRQNFDRHQIGFTKASSTRVNLLAISPTADITAHHSNIIAELLANPDALLDADVVINTTASLRVAAAIEKVFATGARNRAPILSMSIGHRAEYGLATLAVPGAMGTVRDLDRRTKIALANAPNGREFLDEFWPRAEDRPPTFQPEPGCSDPTFIGSAADVLGLSAALLNVASGWLSDTASPHARACVVRAPHLAQSTRRPGLIEFRWSSDRQIVERRQRFQIRLAPDAERELRSWIRTSARRVGPRVETGGLLFGEIDEFLKVIWITEISGPPPDSVASELEFVCGVQGTQELHEEKERRTRGAVRFLGMWHTHPGGIAEPSGTDLGAMQKLRASAMRPPRNFLMLIVGGHSPDYEIQGYLFGR